MNKMHTPSAPKQHDLIVLSDLHLGEGLNEEERRYSPTEDFFNDKQFANLLATLMENYKHDPSHLRLVLNGDSFDFLTILKVPDEEEASKRGFRVRPVERNYGLNPTAKKSVYKLEVIAKGHPIFFHALARFIAAGFSVEILRGNHDLELHFMEVRAKLLDILASYEDGPDLETLAERVRFHEWFYLEPGRVYIEHGNQYEAGNSIRYPLHPILPNNRRRPEEEEILDYPLGSVLVRFIYNRVRQLDPYSPRMVSFDHYLDFIKTYNLFDVVRVFRATYPHFVAALGPGITTGSASSTQSEDARQEATFSRLANGGVEFGDLYRELNKLKVSPASASKLNVVRAAVTVVIRRALLLSVFAFVVLFLWFGILQLIDFVPWIAANAFLMSLFAVLTIAGTLSAWIHLQRKIRKNITSSEAILLYERANKIAQLTQTKMVLLGHSHMVDYRRIADGKAVYANSGTWTSVDNPWKRFMRDARRLTLLYVKGDDVSLKRWNDDASRFDDVPIFYLEKNILPDRIPVELSGSLSKHPSWLPNSMFAQDEEIDGEDSEE
jgi:UDP-2,3-diacylglucosamine pyrophosphatase LpxH